ncbi:DUF4291 domain-containing protein [Pseudenhygromyxa sp. WMMC2535]|nr:DUF4291 domain-containing protein [Pseudenhygromyxa sp. WMMC2535]
MTDSIWRHEAYSELSSRWPRDGRHILASYDAETIIVYQAYAPAIGHAAAEDGKLGRGGFSFDRMSWIKPNFLWMMYRSGWGTKKSQEVTLALQLRRDFFDGLLASCVPSSYQHDIYDSKSEWQAQVKASTVRIQWDPDHHPSGAPVDRRALQLGLRGPALRQMADQATVSIRDISKFVAEQRTFVTGRRLNQLFVPDEKVYPVESAQTRERLKLSDWP